MTNTVKNVNLFLQFKFSYLSFIDNRALRTTSFLHLGSFLDSFTNEKPDAAETVAMFEEKEPVEEVPKTTPKVAASKSSNDDIQITADTLKIEEPVSSKKNGVTQKDLNDLNEKIKTDPQLKELVSTFKKLKSYYTDLSSKYNKLDKAHNNLKKTLKKPATKKETGVTSGSISSNTPKKSTTKSTTKNTTAPAVVVPAQHVINS